MEKNECNESYTKKAKPDETGQTISKPANEARKSIPKAAEAQQMIAQTADNSFLSLNSAQRLARNRFLEAEAAGVLTEELIWETLRVFEECEFYTSRGIRFTYIIRGYEMFVDRKEKSITKATVMLFAERARALQAAGTKITGPKKVGTFGASYLLPVFREIGLIESES